MTKQYNEEIKSIMKNGHASIAERVKDLTLLESKFHTQIQQAKDELTKDYKYCHKCSQYYNNASWGKIKKIEHRYVCVFRDSGYGDDDEYDWVDIHVTYDVCPCGHEIEVSHYSY